MYPGPAHNVPLVDGQGQQVWERGQLEAFSPTSVSASQPHYRDHVRASRALRLDGPRLLDLVSLETSEGSTTIWDFSTIFREKSN